MSLRELKDAAIEQQNAMDASYVFIIALTVKSMHSFLRVTFQSSVFCLLYCSGKFFVVCFQYRYRLTIEWLSDSDRKAREIDSVGRS